MLQNFKLQTSNSKLQELLSHQDDPWKYCDQDADQEPDQKLAVGLVTRVHGAGFQGLSEFYERFPEWVQCRLGDF